MKPATAKAKGRATEQMLCDWLVANGVPGAERRRLAGIEDRGDVAGWPQVCIEVKSGAKIDLAGFLAELSREQRNAGAAYGFVAIRPKGKPRVDDWYAVLPLPALVELIQIVQAAR